MKYQKGFLQLLIGGWAYLVYAAVAVVAIYSVYQFIDNTWETDAGISRGKAIVKADWDKANAKADEDQKEQRKRDAAIVANLEKQKEQAKRDAEEWKLKWRNAYNAWQKSKTPLTTAACPGSDKPVDTRFTWAFVGLYDAAHTRSGPGGQPIFGNPDTIAAAGPSPAASSPYGPQELLEVHKTNSDRWTDCRRELNYTIDVLEKLQKEHRIAP